MSANPHPPAPSATEENLIPATSNPQPSPDAPADSDPPNPSRPIKPLPKRKRARAGAPAFPPPDPTRSGFGDRYAHNSSSLMASHASSLLEQGAISSNMAKQLSQPWHKSGVLKVEYDDAYLEGMTKLQPGFDLVVMPTKSHKKKKADNKEWEQWLEEGSGAEDDEMEEEDDSDLSDEEQSGDEMEVEKKLKNDTKAHRNANASTNNGLRRQELLPDFDDSDSELSSIASEDLDEMGADREDDDETDVDEEVGKANGKKRQKKAALAEHEAKRTKGNAGTTLPKRGEFKEFVQQYTYYQSNQDGAGSTQPAVTPQKKKSTTIGVEAKPPRKIAPLKKKPTSTPTSTPSSTTPKKSAPKSRKSTTNPAPTGPYSQDNYFALLALCRSRNLPGKGREADLRARLVEDDDNVRNGRERKLNLTRKGGRRKGWVHDDRGGRVDGKDGMEGRRRERGRFVKGETKEGGEGEEGGVGVGGKGEGKRKRDVEEDEDEDGEDVVGGEDGGEKKGREKKKARVTEAEV